jgi:hypothetical protein
LSAGFAVCLFAGFCCLLVCCVLLFVGVLGLLGFAVCWSAGFAVFLFAGFCCLLECWVCCLFICWVLLTSFLSFSSSSDYLKPDLLSGCEPGLWVTEGSGWFGMELSGGAVSAGWGPVGDGALLGTSLLMSSV